MPSNQMKFDPEKANFTNPFQLHRIYFQKEFIVLPPDVCYIEINFENTLLEVFAGERANLILQLRISDEQLKNLQQLHSQHSSERYQAVEKYLHHLGISIEEINEDYINLEWNYSSDNDTEDESVTDVLQLDELLSILL